MLKMRKLAVGFFLLTVASIACASSGSFSAQTSSFQTENIKNTSSQLLSECTHSGALDSYDECAPAVQPPLEGRAYYLSREERTIYAGFNQKNLSRETKQKLDSLADSLTSEQNVTGIRIVGYADRMGSPAVNERLSEERAEAVQRYLISKGLIKAHVADTRWFGAGAPSTDCADSLPRTQMIDCLQQDRRVEIEVDYKINPQTAR